MRGAVERRRRAFVAAAMLAAVAGGVLGGLGGTAGLVGAPERASAHDFLESTSPAADATVTDALETVSLTFNSPPLADGAAAIAIEVHDPSGANIATGPVAIVDATLSVPVAPTAVGVHQVLWQTVSSGGHPVSGQYTFDYEGPIPPPTADASPLPTATVTAAPTAAPAPEATASGAAPSGDESGPATGGGVTPLVWVGIAAAAGVLAVVLAVVLLVLRRRPVPVPDAPQAAPEAADPERDGD